MTDDQLLIEVLKFFKGKPKRRMEIGEKLPDVEARQLTLVITGARKMGLLQKWLGETNDTVYVTTDRGVKLLEGEKR